MKNNTITVVLIPEKHARSIQFKIPLFAFFACLFMLAGGIAYGTWITADYFDILATKRQHEKQAQQLRVQSVRLHSLQSSLQEQNSFLQELKQLDEKLAIIGNGARKNNDLTRLDEVFATLPNNSTEEVSSPVKRNRQRQAQVAKIDAEIIRRKISLLVFEQIVHENKDRLSRIPSIKPIKAGYLTSPYGFRNDPFTGTRRMHYGIDWAYHPYTPIYATANGTVESTRNAGGFGKILTIDHGYGIKTRYAHLVKFEAKPGQKVTRGDLIGRMGNTGFRTTGTHLHYEVLENGKHVNPSKYIFDDLFAIR